MEIEIHVVHYLVISTRYVVLRASTGFFTRKNLLALLISGRIDA